MSEIISHKNAFFDKKSTLVEGTVAAGKQVILEAKSVTTVVYSLK